MNTQSRVSIAGVGGVGKSQIAIEYCYRFKEKYPESQVFWIHSSSTARLEQAYKEIAKNRLIPGWDDPKVNKFQIVHDWFVAQGSCKWLFVLDNCDDMDIFFQSEVAPQGDDPGTACARYIPHNSNGSVLITTRDKRVGRRLANGGFPIQVFPMTIEEGKAMLRLRISTNQDENDMETLLEELEYLPLAIMQAASYISENEISVSEYLKLLRSNDVALLEEEYPDWRRDFEAKNSVLRTWRLTFNLIRIQSPRAAKVLSLMAVLDRQGIPKSLLQNEEEQPVEFITALGTLKSFSLIAAETSGDIFTMHRLVQLSTYNWLKLQGDDTIWQAAALQLLSLRFPDDEHENRFTCQSLSPHVQVVLSYDLSSELDLLSRGSLLYKFGWYEYRQGRYDNAYKVAFESNQIRHNLLGDEDYRTLNSLNLVAIVLRCQGKYEAAVETGRRVLEGTEKAMGKDHADTMTIVHDFALVLQDQGKYKEAEEMIRRSLEGFEKARGKDHRATLTATNSLAQVLYLQGKFEEAEEMSRRALAGYEKVLGKDHPDTLTGVNNFALVLQDQEKYEEGEKMSRRAVEGYEKALGRDHPDTLTSVNNLALVLQFQGKYKEAEEINLWALEGREKVLGKDHPYTLDTVRHLATLFHRQGEYDKALPLYQRSNEGYGMMLGKEHPNYVIGQQNYEDMLELMKARDNRK